MSPWLYQITINYELVVLGKLLTMVAVLTHTEACLFWFIGEVQAPHGWMYEFNIIESMPGVRPIPVYLGQLVEIGSILTLPVLRNRHARLVGLLPLADCRISSLA